MSVDIAGNPWYFAQDGLGTNPESWPGYFNPICPTDVIITSVTIGDTIKFTDWSGRVVINFTAEAGDTSFRYGKIGVIYGLRCVDFDSGEMIVVV